MFEEDVVSAHQHQDRSCSLDQKDLEPPAAKGEQEDGEQLTVKQESDTSLVTPILKEDKQSEDPILDLSPDPSAEKSEANTTGETSVSPEPDCDLQLPSNSPHVAESKDQEHYNAEDLGSTPDEEPKPTVKQNKSKRRPGSESNRADSAVDWNTDTGATSAPCHTGEKQVKAASHLTAHAPVHANDKPDAHSGCGKGTRKRRSLSARTKYHTGPGPFKCETCGKEFKLSAYEETYKNSHR